MKLSAKDNALLSSAERTLLSSKGPWFVKDLIKLIQRVRALRDKSADLLRRQSLASARSTGSKRGGSGNANARTLAKGKVLERALRHFEQELADMNVQSTAAAQALLATMTAPQSASKPAAKKAAPKKAAAGKSVAKSAATRKTAARSKAASKAAPARKTASAKSAPVTAKPASKASARASSKPGPVKAARSSKAPAKSPPKGARSTAPNPAMASRRTRAKRTR